jgi:molybdenum cofactor cytidylyltransferase
MMGESEILRPVAAVVLAAGGSERMGMPKQLLPIEGQPMVRRVAQAVCEAGLAQVIIVVGAYAEAVEQALRGLPVEVVSNDTWAEGLSSSVRAGLGALRPEVHAALMVLADQPALTPGLLQSLVTRYRSTGARIVAPFSRGQRGHPVLIDRTLFPELMAVQGDQGGKNLLARLKVEIERVEWDDPVDLQDVDTLQDYEQARKLGIGSEGLSRNRDD